MLYSYYFTLSFCFFLFFSWLSCHVLQQQQQLQHQCLHMMRSGTVRSVQSIITIVKSIKIPISNVRIRIKVQPMLWVIWGQGIISGQLKYGHAFNFSILRCELLSLDEKSKKYQLINAKTSVNLRGNSNFSHQLWLTTCGVREEFLST